jgi:serine/threonine-protein kinase
MERPLWDRIQELYFSTVPLPRAERSAFLATASNQDQVLVREVNSLLDADDTADGFLDSPVFELGLRVISSTNRDRSNGDGLLPSESLVGMTIDGRYLVEKELGHGGMGKVYLARDATLHHRRVVIKVLLQASLKDPYVVKKFRQEVEALSRIDHPNIVAVLGAGELADRKPYLVLQYVDGVTLRSQIPPEGMELERAALILKQLGAALDDVHEQRILHRDLKPENILLQIFKGGTELVKVVDFGIAKVKDSVVAPTTANNAPVGTFLYMSPEQLRGGERITAASDIYSMAIIAYEMITGRRPFNPTSAPQLLEMHREGVRVNPIDLRPTLATEARAVLLRALSFDPAARYQSAAEFGDRLALALTASAETIRVPSAHPLEKETIEAPSALSPSPVASMPGAAVSRPVWKSLKFVLVSVVIILVGIAVLPSLRKPQPGTDQSQNAVAESSPTSAQQRSFNYWLNVQKMRNGKPYQAQFLSSGKEVFETGYKFRLNVSSPDPGYLYLFNEGPPSPTGSSFTILYPTPLTNAGLASLGANQVIQTNWNKFAGETGTENFWIVWSSAPVPELEAAKADAFKRPHGVLVGDSLVATKNFLIAKQSENKTYYTTHKDTHQTTVRGAGDLLVRMVEFEHR